MEKGIWVGFDLGIRGDYEGFYAWLDSKNAVECGDNLAYFKTEDSKNTVENLKKEIEENVELTKRTRIYLIYRNQKTQKMSGKFIFGTRKAPLWTGYAVKPEQIEEEEA